MSALKTLFNFLRKRHGLSSNPMRKIINPKVEKRLPITVRKEHLENLFIATSIAAAEHNAFSEVRDDLIIDIIYTCGLRRSELMQLRISALDFGRQLIKVQGKGKKERSLPISPALISKIKNYILIRNATINDLTSPVHDYLFMTDKGEPLYAKWVYNLVTKNLSKVSSVERRSPHILRHSFATHLSDEGADLNAIKTLLGHASLAATQIYMHNSIEKLKKVYDQAHPKS